MSEIDAVPTGVPAPLPGFGPVAPQERIETLDIVRGFAVFAILVVNWSTDADYDLEPWKGFDGAPDLTDVRGPMWIMGERREVVKSEMRGSSRPFSRLLSRPP